MTRKESQWLISVLMSVVMIASLLASPMAVMADDNGGAVPGDGQKVVYVNSDGQEIDSKITEDGFVYSEVETEEYKGIEVYGYKGDETTLKVPEKIDGVDVVSFAIDPRWPVWDEIYDQVESIELPKTIVSAHSKYMNYFNGLKSVSIPSGNEYYKSANGVLYKKNEEGCSVAAYPHAKPDTTYVMPEDMNRFYRFYEGCPIESLTISKAITYVSSYGFRNLADLKEIKVSADNKSLYAKAGVLFSIYEDYDEEYNEKTDEYDKVYYSTRSLVYYPPQKEATEYTVPSDTDQIEYLSVSNNPYLKKIVIPEKITSIWDDAFDLDVNLTTVEFKAKEAPEPKDFEDFCGMRDLMREHENKVEIKYPAGATGYEDFIEWMKGKDINYWEEDPELENEEVPLGCNVSPLYGEPYYGSEYTVYSKTINGRYSKDIPSGAGKWYAKLVVDEVDGHTGLESEPFQFTVAQIDEPPAYNYWLRLPYDVEATVGDEFILKGIPYFGQVDKVLYRKAEDAENENAWTETAPTEVGQYDYKLVVDDTEMYEGLVYISSDDDCWITISLPVREISVTCDDIAQGETPQPKAEFNEDEQYDDIDLSKVTFRYEKETKVYVDDPDEDSWEDQDEQGYYNLEFVETDDFSELGEYRAIAVYDSTEFSVWGNDYFNVMTKTELARSKIDDVREPEWIFSGDDERVKEARKAFDALTPSEKEELKNIGEEEGVDYEKALKKAEARLASLKAEDALTDAQADFDLAQTAYDEAKAKADASKAAADQASATPGDAAVAAAVQAKADADDLAAKASDLEKAAEKVTAAANEYAEKAKADPLKTRRDWQDDGRYAKVTEEITNDTKKMESDAKTAANDAQTAVDTETHKAEEAAKDQAAKDAADAKAAADALDKALYTADSFQKVTDALDALDQVLDRKDATSAEINAAVKSLNAAIAGLVKYETKQNPMKVKAKKPKVKLSKLKKKNQKVKKAKAFSVKKAKGKVTFKMAKYDKKAKKKIVISKKGDITVKKGLKKGKYTIKVKVTAAGKTEGNIKYKKLTKQVKVTVTVK